MKNVIVIRVKSRIRRHREVHNEGVRKLLFPPVFKGDKSSGDDTEDHVERMGQMHITVWSRETRCETCV